MSLNMSSFNWSGKLVSNTCVKTWTGGCFLISGPPVQGKLFRVEAKTVKDLLRALTGLTGPSQPHLGPHPNPSWSPVPLFSSSWGHQYLLISSLGWTWPQTLGLPYWGSGMGPALPDPMRSTWCSLALMELLSCAGRRDTSLCLKYKWMQNRKGWIF